MKKLVNFISILTIAYVLTGCLGNESVNVDDTNYQNDDTYTASVIPPKMQGTGVDFNITGYLFPYRALVGGIVKKRYTVTSEDPSGYFNQQKTILTHQIQGIKDDLGDTIIHIFENNKLVEKDTITPNHITVNAYDSNDILSGTEQYPVLIRKNEDLLRNEKGACVLKQRIESFDITAIIPIQAYPDPQNPPMTYGSVLHFYCGTIEGARIDRYYADGWGTIGVITRLSDGSTTYSVFDPNSYEEL